jgi:type I restriction enzyme S subunit
MNDMKHGWEVKKLGEVCEDLFAGGDVPKDNFSKEKSDVHTVPIYSNGETNKGLYGFTNISRVTKPSITISARGTIGYSEIRNENFYPAVRLIVITPKLDILELSFLKYAISKIDFTHSGSSIPQLTVPMIKEYPIPLPSLAEQQHIISILDEAFAAIAKAKANAEKNLKNARELFESYLQSIFENKGEGWEEKTLSEVLKKTESVDPTKKPNDEFIYLDVSSVNKETKEIENATVLIGKDAPSRARKLIKTNDVIFATVRPTHSRVALITEEYNEQVCSTGYFVLRAKEFLNNQLVYYFLLTYGFNKQMEKLQKGASYPAVTDNEVKGITIPYPKSLNEQLAIVQKLDALSIQTKKLEAIYQQKIADLEELKKSILQKAFNGELNLEPVTA